MPTPRSGEERSDFVSRCIPIVKRDGIAKSDQQAVAVCNSLWEQKMSNAAQYIRFTGLANGAQLRTASLYGIDHIVIPVVAMVGNSIVRPMHSSGPEFVPAEELAIAPSAWDGRPVVPDHPEGGTASANRPDILQSQCFGYLFNTRFENNALQTEAWLNPARAQQVGPDALKVLQRVYDKETIEVSVGAWVIHVAESGSFAGENFDSRWSNVRPDHLAMLPEGTLGACNNEMGCGAPRAAAYYQVPVATLRAAAGWEEPVNSNDITTNNTADPDIPKVKGTGIVQRVLDLFRSNEGMSDVELRDALWSALNADVPAFEGIVRVFPDDNKVIYLSYPEDAPIYWERSFSVNGEGEISLAGEATEVKREEQFVPASGPAPEDDPSTIDAATADCTCQQGEGLAARAQTNEGGHHMSDKITKLVGRLIANERSPFTDEDADTLSALCETKLASLAEQYESDPPPVADPEPQADPPAPVPDTTKDEEVQALQAKIDRLTPMAEAYERQQAKHKEALVASLASAQSVVSEEALRERSIEALEELAAVVGASQPEPEPEYGRPMPVERGQAETPPAPPSMAEAIAARRSQASN